MLQTEMREQNKAHSGLDFRPHGGRTMSKEEAECAGGQGSPPPDCCTLLGTGEQESKAEARAEQRPKSSFACGLKGRSAK